MEYIDLILKGQVYLFLIVFVMMIAGMVKENKLFDDVFCFFQQNLKSKKAVVAIVSAITGLLPIKGRVTVSAGLLETLAPDKGCCGREKFGPIDYVSTHHYYFWSPLEKTIILPMAAFFFLLDALASFRVASRASFSLFTCFFRRAFSHRVLYFAL